MAQFRQQAADRHVSISDDHLTIRIPTKHPIRIRRQIRPDKRPLPLAAVLAVALTLTLAVAFFAFRRLLIAKEIGESELDLEKDWGNYSKELKFGHLGGGYEEVGSGLYNEGGRAELKSYGEEYEAALRRNGGGGGQVIGVDNGDDDDYDDGIDLGEDHDHDHEEGGSGGGGDDVGSEENGEDEGGLKGKEGERKDEIFVKVSKNGNGKKMEKELGLGKKVSTKKKPRHHRGKGF